MNNDIHTPHSNIAVHSLLNNDIHTPHSNKYIVVRSLIRQHTATYISIRSLAFTRTASKTFKDKSVKEFSDSHLGYSTSGYSLTSGYHHHNISGMSIAESVGVV